MFRLMARTTSLCIAVLVFRLGDTSQFAWAEDEVVLDPKAMAEECMRGGGNKCARVCLRAASVKRSSDLEDCRAAYNAMKARQSEPATTSADETTNDTQPEAVSRGASSTPAGVDKVTVMGVPLCGDVVQAGEYLEGRGYKNAAMFANSMRKINVSRRDGNNNYDFKINYGGPRKRDSIYLMSFHGSFQDGPNLFEVERSKFEEATGIKLTCNSLRRGPKETRLECKYPVGEADRSRPGFSYSIAHDEGQKAFFVDASAWGYEECGP